MEADHPVRLDALDNQDPAKFLQEGHLERLGVPDIQDQAKFLEDSKSEE
jgi:hypothetical protein